MSETITIIEINTLDIILKFKNKDKSNLILNLSKIKITITGIITNSIKKYLLFAVPNLYETGIHVNPYSSAYKKPPKA